MLPRNMVCRNGVCDFTPAQPTAKPDAISAAQFRQEVLESRVPVVVEFMRTDKCPRCKAAEPTVTRLAREQGARVKVVKIDVDLNPALAARYKVGPLPHFLRFEDGVAVKSQAPTLIKGEVRRREFKDDQVIDVFTGR